MKVELIFATTEGTSSEELEVAEGTTVDEAVAASRFASTSAAAVGIFGQVVTADRVLEDGDRLELLRELLIDPKDARRMRAAVKS